MTDMDTPAGEAPPGPASSRRSSRARALAPAAAAAVRAAPHALHADGGDLRRRARIDPRRVPAGPGRDRHGLPRRRRARAAPRGRRGDLAGRPASPVRSGHGRRAHRDGAGVIHPPCPEPGPPPAPRGDWMAFGTVGSPPNVADLDRGRRIGNREDYQNLLRLGQIAEQRPFPGRLSGRAGRPPPRGPLPARHARRADPDGQGHPLLQPGPAAQHRRPRDGPDRPRRGRGHARPRAVGVHRRQLVVRRCAWTPRCSRASWPSPSATRSCASRRSR